MFKKILSTQFTTSQINTCLFILRISVAILMMSHGYQKFSHFAEKQDKFMSFMGMSSSASLSLTIFAELFCSAFLALGLLTRIVLIPLLITMLVAVLMAHGFDVFGEGQLAFVYLISYLVLFISGPGSISADQLLFNKKY